MQTSANIRRTSANKGQQYANVCKHSEDVCKPRPAAAIPCGPVGVRSSDQRRAGTRCSPLDGSMGTYLQFPRVISADRASSCDPHGRGLDAQPWIQWPEVCTTPDPMAESMHNHGSQGRKFADVCKHSENVCKPRPAAAIPCGPVGIPSSDQRRPGQQYAQPWIHGPA
jgi:hypothetical protein